MEQVGKSMTVEEFLAALEAQLELPSGSLRQGRALAEIDGWDSMAPLLFISLADLELGVAISGDQIAGSETVDDLLALLGDRLIA